MTKLLNAAKLTVATVVATAVSAAGLMTFLGAAIY